MSAQKRRFVALDVHKSYVMVGAVDAEQQIALHPRRVAFNDFETWVGKHLRSSDELVLEATTNAWLIHDMLEPVVARVVVAHPYHVKLISAATVKTDKRDTLALAKLLAAKMIPEVWVPPVHVRELRALIAHPSGSFHSALLLRTGYIPSSIDIIWCPLQAVPLQMSIVLGGLT